MALELEHRIASDLPAPWRREVEALIEALAARGYEPLPWAVAAGGQAARRQRLLRPGPNRRLVVFHGTGRVPRREDRRVDGDALLHVHWRDPWLRPVPTFWPSEPTLSTDRRAAARSHTMWLPGVVAETEETPGLGAHRAVGILARDLVEAGAVLSTFGNLLRQRIDIYLPGEPQVQDPAFLARWRQRGWELRIHRQATDPTVPGYGSLLIVPRLGSGFPWLVGPALWNGAVLVVELDNPLAWLVEDEGTGLVVDRFGTPATNYRLAQLARDRRRRGVLASRTRFVAISGLLSRKRLVERFERFVRRCERRLDRGGIVRVVAQPGYARS